ncbi:hypothetical protein DL93DRAFT_2086157 [Clavulina sp. PMI_390]|nr:hypothetical protein DL93DRAFT_2086157 [Clavulina sp. PMI_390]
MRELAALLLRQEVNLPLIVYAGSVVIACSPRLDCGSEIRPYFRWPYLGLCIQTIPVDANR